MPYAFSQDNILMFLPLYEPQNFGFVYVNSRIKVQVGPLWIPFYSYSSTSADLECISVDVRSDYMYTCGPKICFRRLILSRYSNTWDFQKAVTEWSVCLSTLSCKTHEEYSSVARKM